MLGFGQGVPLRSALVQQCLPLLCPEGRPFSPVVVAVEGDLDSSQADSAMAAERRSDSIRFTFDAVV